MKNYLYIALVILLLSQFGALFAQDPDAAQNQPVEKIWSGSFGAGLSLTSGNTDTTNFNASFDLVRDPKTRNLMKFNGLYLRGDQDDETTIDRLRLSFRDEYTLNDRTFVYGDFGYVRDPFKDISYLLNPNGGIGYKLVNTDAFQFQLNGGAGAVWEKNSDTDVTSSGSLNFGEDLVFKLSDTARITQVFSALWKMDDFEDSLLHFGAGIAASITSRTELKLEFINDFKNKPPSEEIKKNDMAFVASFLFKL